MTAAGPRTVLIACGALAREVLAVLDQQGLEGVDLRCLPAELHNRPDRIPEAVRAKIRQAKAEGARPLVLYGDCGTGGRLDAVLAEEGAERIAGPHCYAFFSGLDRFAETEERDVTSFFLTDFLARQFDAIVWAGLGLDRHPELCDVYFGNYERVVYLAQTDDPDLTAKAEGAARRLGLAFERRLTGYGDLARVLAA